MSENNNELERNYEVAERREGGPIVVNSFSQDFRKDGMPVEVPEVLRDPRSKDHFTKMFDAFSEAIDGVFNKK